MLKNEMTIEQDGLDLSQKTIVAVEMCPARLHHANLWIGKVMDHLHQPFLGRHKVGVEDGHKLAHCYAQTFVQRAGFEAIAIVPVDVDDVVSQGLIKFNRSPGGLHSTVGGIVQHLTFKLARRIVKVATSADQTVNDD